jgi:hypothetical protein
MQDRGRAFGALGPREWPPRIDRFRIDLLIPRSPMSLPSSALPAGFIAPCLPTSVAAHEASSGPDVQTFGEKYSVRFAWVCSSVAERLLERRCGSASF